MLNRKLSNASAILREGLETVGLHAHHEWQGKGVAPVAFIIIFSEALHNFIDGLSIGAAFSENVIEGLSLSLAIVCEEFPHKLGDFAIMIGAGMPFKMAIISNLISSSFIYGGVALGIVLGEEFHASIWIYGIAGGMFLYISVCDMVNIIFEFKNHIFF
jgi:zinc transporter ZupT